MCTQLINLDVGWSDNGKECKTSCSHTHGNVTEYYYWCWTLNSKKEKCTPNKHGMDEIVKSHCHERLVEVSIKTYI